MNATWIVAADRTGARIFSTGPEGLALVQTLENEEGALKDSEVGTDRPGRAYNRSNPGRHAVESPTSPHEQSAITFAHELAHALRSGREQGRLTSLVLAAEPHFLGLIREALDPPTARLVSKTVSKDLQHLSTEELRKRLAQV